MRLRSWQPRSGPQLILRRQDIKQAFIKVGIGAEKKSRVISEKEKTDYSLS